MFGNSMKFPTCRWASVFVIFQMLTPVEGALTGFPMDVAVRLGGLAKFECTTNVSDQPMDWFQTRNSNGPLPSTQYIFLKGRLQERFRPHFNVTTSQDGRLWTMVISPVDVINVGTYACRDAKGLGEQANATLGVVDCSLSDDDVKITTTSVWLDQFTIMDDFTTAAGSDICPKDSCNFTVGAFVGFIIGTLLLPVWCWFAVRLDCVAIEREKQWPKCFNHVLPAHQPHIIPEDWARPAGMQRSPQKTASPEDVSHDAVEEISLHDPRTGLSVFISEECQEANVWECMDE